MHLIAKYHIRKSIGGFTLIELMLVVAIIGIISSVVVASIANARAKARDAVRIADLGAIAKSLDLYFDTMQSYPENETGVADANQLVGVNNVSSVLTPAYLPNLPGDPLVAVRPPEEQYLYEGLDASGADCSVALTCVSYALGATLEIRENVILDSDLGDSIATTAFRGLGLENCDGGATMATDGVDEKCYSKIPQ